MDEHCQQMTIGFIPPHKMKILCSCGKMMIYIGWRVDQMEAVWYCDFCAASHSEGVTVMYGT